MATEVFTKLTASILDSTVWSEDNDTRIVWITMLAMADRRGYVGASVPGLAARARISLEGTENAITRLSSPDKYSRSKELEGRRIIDAERGWLIVNYGKHRGFRDPDDRRKYDQERKRLARMKDQSDPSDQDHFVHFCPPPSAAVHHGPPQSAQAEAELEAEADQDRGSVRIETNPEIEVPSVVCVPRKNRSATDLPYSASFERFWKCYPNKTGKGKAWAVWQRIKPDLQLAGKFEDAIAWQITQPQWQKDGGQFIPHAATWLNQKRWQDEPFNPPVDDFDAMFDAVAARMGVR
jgi:hypothetical protein